MTSALLFFLPSQCCVSVLTHHLCISQPCLFLFTSICYSLFCKAKQRRNSWYWRISVCLAVFFLFRCWTLGNWGYSNLKRFNYTSLAFGLLSFLLGNAGTNYFSRPKRELVFILRFAFARHVSPRRVQAWMFWVKMWTACMWFRNKNLQDTTILALPL